MRVFRWAGFAGLAALIAAAALGLQHGPATAAGYGSAPYWAPGPGGGDPQGHGRFGHRDPPFQRDGKRPQPGACANNTALGAVLGAGIGGLIGSTTTTDPDGRVAGTAMGALVGAILGGFIGQSIDHQQGC